MNEMTYPPLAAFLFDEMKERGWDCRDVAARMPGDYTENLLSFSMLMVIHRDNLILGRMAGDVALAFGVSSDFIVNIDTAWRNNKDRREQWECPEIILPEIIFPANDALRQPLVIDEDMVERAVVGFAKHRHSHITVCLRRVLEAALGKDDDRIRAPDVRETEKP